VRLNISIVLIFLVSCATPNYRAVHDKPATKDESPEEESIESLGIYDGDIPFTSRIEKIRLFYYDKEDDDDHAGNLPAGIKIRKGRVRIKRGSGHKLISKLMVSIPTYTAKWDESPVISFYPYRPEESWRRYYCHPQTVMSWLTLGIWNIVPLMYPCKTPIVNQYFDDMNLRRDILKKALKAEALRKKGNAVIGIAYNFGRKDIHHQDSGGNYVATTSKVVNFVYADGWVVKLKKTQKKRKRRALLRPELNTQGSASL
jgi:hypothetical protein